MLTRTLLAAAILLPQVILPPQVSLAADFDTTPYLVAPHRHHLYRHHVTYHHVRRHYAYGPYMAEDHVVRCTTTKTGLFSVSDCGQGFAPFSAAGF